MSVQDYPALIQAAAQAQSLDSLRLATHGKPLSLTSLLGTVGPAVHSFTGVWVEEGKPRCFGQVLHQEGKAHGQLTYLAPKAGCEDGAVTGLLEHLIQVSGRWGTRYLLADLAEDSEYLPAFRRADFNIWSRQKVLRFSPGLDHLAAKKYRWRPWASCDVKAMLALYHAVVPKLFQTLEPHTRKAAIGMVLYDEEENLLGYADLAYGPHGIWVQPVLSPKASDGQILLDLMADLPDGLHRPVYLSLRSHQPWLEALAADLPASLETEQVLLVRYLVLQEELPEEAAQTVFNSNHSESSIPVIQTRRKEGL